MKRFFLVILFSLFSMSAVYAAEAGKILFVYGKAEIVRDKNTLVAKRGALIQAGDIIKTAKASTAQIKLSDGTLVALKPSSEWNLQEFVYNKQNPGLGKQSSELLKGGLRAVTGLIGKADPKKVKYTAGTTTIGIRGTTFELVLIPKGIERGVYVQVETGQVLVSNKFGSMNAYPQKIVKTTTNQAPVEIFSTKVFKPVDEDINKDKESFQTQTKKQANNKSAKQTQEEEQEDSSQQNSSAEISLKNLTDDEPLPDRKISAINTKTSQIVEAQTDKREETLKYHTLALQIKDSGVFSDSKFYPSNNQFKKSEIVLNKKMINFINSQGEFKGKGYKELKAAYDKLPASEKAKLAALPTYDANLSHNPSTNQSASDKKTIARDPLRYLNGINNFKKTKVEFVGKKTVFSKVDDNDFDANDNTSANKDNVLYKSWSGVNYIGLKNKNFIMPSSIFKYKVTNTHSLSNDFETGSRPRFDFGTNNENYIKINFADKKFEDAKIAFKNPSNNKEYFYSGVGDKNFILEDGTFLMKFALAKYKEGNQFKNIATMDKAGLSGSFFQDSTDSNKHKAIAVFGHYIDQKNRFLGYIVFEKE